MIGQVVLAIGFGTELGLGGGVDGAFEDRLVRQIGERGVGFSDFLGLVESADALTFGVEGD